MIHTDPVSLAAVGFQVGILACLLVAVGRGVTAASVNAAVALAATLVPAGVEFLGRTALEADLVLGPELTLWIALAGFLHSVGMLGPYDTTAWWDHLTHTVSASLVAALAYAALLVVVEGSAGSGRPGAVVALATLGITLGLGVFWELAELVAREAGERYDIEPVLVVYGWRDTALDIVFDVVGALAVVVLDLRVFVPLAAQDPGLARDGLLLAALVTLGGSAVAVAVLAVANRDAIHRLVA